MAFVGGGRKNIALEHAAPAGWVGSRRWMRAVVAVNLATHPLFTLALAHFGMSLSVILPCEVAIVFLEWVILLSFYGRYCASRLFFASIVMNATSYLTGVLISM